MQVLSICSFFSSLTIFAVIKVDKAAARRTTGWESCGEWHVAEEGVSGRGEFFFPFPHRVSVNQMNLMNLTFVKP